MKVLSYKLDLSSMPLMRTHTHTEQIYSHITLGMDAERQIVRCDKKEMK